MLAKIFSIVLTAVVVAACSAKAQTVLSVIDTSLPDLTCDTYLGRNPPQLRNCYIPIYNGNGAFAPSHSDQNFSIQITVTQSTVVDVTYDQEVFLNTANGPTPAYSISIGVDSTMIPCGHTPGYNLDSPGAIGIGLHAECVVTVAAGTHTFYALEAARKGAFAFHGAPNQILVVRY